MIAFLSIKMMLQMYLRALQLRKLLYYSEMLAQTSSPRLNIIEHVMDEIEELVDSFCSADRSTGAESYFSKKKECQIDISSKLIMQR